MIYTKLATEIFKLYMELYNEFHDSEQALELTKFCLGKFPCFEEMIEEEYI